MGAEDQEPEDQRTRGPEDQRTRGPEDQGTRTRNQRIRKPGDQRTSRPEDQGTRGPEDQNRRKSPKGEPNQGRRSQTLEKKTMPPPESPESYKP